LEWDKKTGQIILIFFGRLYIISYSPFANWATSQKKIEKKKKYGFPISVVDRREQFLFVLKALKLKTVSP